MENKGKKGEFVISMSWVQGLFAVFGVGVLLVFAVMSGKGTLWGIPFPLSTSVNYIIIGALFAVCAAKSDLKKRTMWILEVGWFVLVGFCLDSVCRTESFVELIFLLALSVLVFIIEVMIGSHTDFASSRPRLRFFALLYVLVGASMFIGAGVLPSIMYKAIRVLAFFLALDLVSAIVREHAEYERNIGVIKGMRGLTETEKENAEKTLLLHVMQLVAAFCVIYGDAFCTLHEG